MTKGAAAGTNPFTPEESLKTEASAKNPFASASSVSTPQELEDPSELHGYTTWRILKETVDKEVISQNPFTPEEIANTEPSSTNPFTPEELVKARPSSKNAFTPEELVKSGPCSTNPFTPEELKPEASSTNPFAASSKNPFTPKDDSFSPQEVSAAITLQSLHRGNMARRSMKRNAGVAQFWRDVVPNLRAGAEVVLNDDEQSMLRMTEELKLRKGALGVVKEIAHNGNRLVAWPYCNFEDVWVGKDLLAELIAMPVAEPTSYACAWKYSNSSTWNPVRWSKVMDMETATCDLETFANKNVATPPQVPITLTITCRTDGAVVRHLRFDQPTGAVAFLQKECQQQQTTLKDR